MYEIKKETLEWAHKPYDIVTDIEGNVGFIQEVSVNDCQESPEAQISYSVNWLTGDNYKTAWFDHDELTYQCNMFVKIAESSCHAFGSSANSVQALFNHINK